jgi:hypothetical protein
MAQPISNAIKNPFGFTGATVSPFGGKKTVSPFSPPQSGPMSVAPKVQTPVQPVQGTLRAPTASVAPKTASTGSVGAYKGVSINPGSDAQIAAQIAQIDGTPATAPALKPAPTGALLSANLPTETVQTEKPRTFSGLVGTLATAAQTPTQQVSDAFKAQQERSAALRGFRESVADTKQGIFSAPTSARVMQGRDQAVQLANAQKEAALAAELTAATDLYGSSLTGQGQQLTALGTAAGLAQPGQAAFGQTVFDPLTGQYTGGGGLPAETMQQYAQMAASGQISSVPSFITSNPVLNAQLNEAAKAINPNFSPITSAAQGEIIASLPELEAVNTQAEGIKNKIVSYLNSNPGLNPSTLAAGNILQQWIQGKQLADPRYQTLFNYLNEYTSTLAPILGVGGDTTNLKTEIAQSFINAKASGQSIAQVLDSMSQLAEGKIQDRRSGALGGGVVSSPGGATTSFAEQW